MRRKHWAVGAYQALFRYQIVNFLLGLLLLGFAPYVYLCIRGGWR